MNAPAHDFPPGPGGRLVPPGRIPARRRLLACVGVLLLAVALAPACSRPKTAAYLGMEARPILDTNGGATMTYTGNAVVRLNDGLVTVVICDKATARSLTPGIRVVLLPQGQGWRVKPMAYPKPAAQAPAAP